MNNEFHVQVLRAKIRGLQAEGVTIQRRIARVKGETKHSLRCRKNMLGHFTRYHLLAYAFFRGVPYRCVEQRSRSALDIGLLLSVLKAHSDLDWMSKEPHLRGKPWAQETVERWLRAVELGSVES